MDSKAMWQLAVAILVPVLGGFIGGISTAGEIKKWYAKLKKPSWNPPNYLFGPVWTVLYVCIGVASWMVYNKGGWPKQWEPLMLYVIQLLLNFAWTPLFFKYHRVDIAMIEIVVMLIFQLLTANKFAKVIGVPMTLCLFGPYIAWTSFATALTATILSLNPEAHKIKTT